MSSNCRMHNIDTQLLLIYRYIKNTLKLDAPQIFYSDLRKELDKFLLIK